MFECLVLKISVGAAGSSLINSVHESWLEVRTEFPTMSEMALNTRLPF